MAFTFRTTPAILSEPGASAQIGALAETAEAGDLAAAAARLKAGGGPPGLLLLWS